MAVARILGAKGLVGAFRVEPLTDRRERLEVGSLLFLEGEQRPRRVTVSEPGGRMPVLALEGIGDRPQAEALGGRYLEAVVEPLPAGTYYWHEIVGLRVSDAQGAELGTVVEVFRTGENEVYRVEGPAGELLLPATHDVVRSIDLDAGRMTVTYEAEEVG